jgi:hypothetical protein
MDNKERKGSNIKIALIIGAVALAWYLVSMFTVWNQ